MRHATIAINSADPPANASDARRPMCSPSQPPSKAPGPAGMSINQRIGPGPCLVLGIAVCGAGWLLLSFAPANVWGTAMFAVMLVLFGTGAVLVFINFLALRQAVTPEPLLGRMTSTMRWLILIPAGPGALLGGWLGEHIGLRASLAFAGGSALLMAIVAWRIAVIRDLRKLPEREHERDWVGGDAMVRPGALMDPT